jgi:hypothetical protein
MPPSTLSSPDYFCRWIAAEIRPPSPLLYADPGAFDPPNGSCGARGKTSGIAPMRLGYCVRNRMSFGQLRTQAKAAKEARRSKDVWGL